MLFALGSLIDSCRLCGSIHWHVCSRYNCTEVVYMHGYTNSRLLSHNKPHHQAIMVIWQIGVATWLSNQIGGDSGNPSGRPVA